MTDTMNLFQHAERIADRAANTRAVQAVFLVNEDGEIRLRATRTTTQSFAKSCKEHPELFVGCYDGGIDPAQIVDDAKAAIKAING